MIWSKKFVTNVGPIDRQHQLLAALCDMYRVIVDLGMERELCALMLADLARDANAHFDVEDEMMPCRSRMTALHHHRADDDHVFRELRRYQARLAESEWSADDARDCLDMFERWLVDHMTHLDADIHSDVIAA